MSKKFKFVEPSVTDTIVELDPVKGTLYTDESDAEISYEFIYPSTVQQPRLYLSISEQVFLVSDLDELISFLQAAKTKLDGGTES